MSTLSNGAHILVYPFPAPGHIIPLLDLTRLLLTRGLSVTVLVALDDLPLLQPLLSTHPSTSLQPLVLTHPPNTPNSGGLVGKVSTTGALYQPIVQWFRSHPNPPVAIISDFYLGWTTNLARELAVPRVVFWASGAFGASFLDSLFRHLPKNDASHDNNFLIRLSNVQNSPEYPWWQMPNYYRSYKKGDPDSEFFRDTILANMESWGIVFNTFNDLEKVYIDYIKNELLRSTRVWAVGPLLPNDESITRGAIGDVPCHEVMTWLDTKAAESVVYVCFGSRGGLTSKQTKALVDAIECSGVHFIWAAMKAMEKGQVVDEVDAILNEFQDRVGSKGFIIRGWAPQVAILRHQAVGAFVTHCGWNSVLEGLSAGVVMLTWPMGTDQFTNAKLLVEQIGVGVEACEGGAESVPDSAELARLLGESVSKTGPKRARVVELCNAALKAVKGGSSSKDLEDFINQLRRDSKVDEL